MVLLSYDKKKKSKQFANVYKEEEKKLIISRMNSTPSELGKHLFCYLKFVISVLYVQVLPDPPPPQFGYTFDAQHQTYMQDSKSSKCLFNWCSWPFRGIVIAIIFFSY